MFGQAEVTGGVGPRVPLGGDAGPAAATTLNTWAIFYPGIWPPRVSHLRLMPAARDAS
jgi:hypothetical protein